MRQTQADRTFARQQLVRLLVEQIVREALATRSQPPEPTHASSPVRALQHRPAARNLDR